VTISDANSGATDTLTITVGGTGGTLTCTGLSGGAGGVYTLSGSAYAVTTDLDALSFKAPAGAHHAVVPTITGTVAGQTSDQRDVLRRCWSLPHLPLEGAKARSMQSLPSQTFGRAVRLTL
jgi:hypothetical protein